MGREAKERVRHRFLGTRTLIQAIELYERHPHAGGAGAPISNADLADISNA
jgi:hypothetical protein